MYVGSSAFTADRITRILKAENGLLWIHRGNVWIAPPAPRPALCREAAKWLELQIGI